MSDETARLVITITKEMHEALKSAARDSSNTLSGISRLALYDWLKKEGYPLDTWYVEWGGNRDGSSD